jgi:hypothetical protein
MNQKRGNIEKYITFCGGINGDGGRKFKQKSLNIFVD